MLPLVIVPPQGEENDDPSFDIPSLFLHLLLFDTVIISSARLLEISALVKTVGAAQTIELLESGALKIRSGADGLASANNNDPTLVQLIHYVSRDPDLLSKEMAQFHRLGLPKKTTKRLKLAVANRWLPLPDETGWGLPALQQTETDATSNRQMFEAAVRIELKKMGLEPGECNIRLEKGPNSGLLKLHGQIDGVSDRQLIEAVRFACLDIAALNGAFSKMKYYDAVAALADDCLPLMEPKLDFLWKDKGPDALARPFRRVLTVRGLPSFEESLRDKAINIEKFLEVRGTPECREFRSFLRQSESLDDGEIAARTASLRARIGMRVDSAPGRILRILALAAVGTLAVGPVGAVVGLALDGVDGFLVDRLFPTSGVVTFLGKQYPSIFKR